MGTSAGPNLAGIGRGGESNLVLEMDAHDAKSYPGEPTFNTLLNGYFPGTDTTTVTAGWTLHGTAAITTYRPAAEEFFYKNLGLSNPRVFQINGGGSHADGSYTRCGMPNPTPGFSTSTATTVSFWYRFTGQNAAQLSNQKIHVDLDYGLADVYANYTDYNDTEWHLFSATQTSSGSYAYYNLYIYAPALSACPGGSYFEIGAFQIEQKGYATPFVGDGQFARPASVNLSLNGGSYEDKSPEKLVLAQQQNMAMPGLRGKFGGAAYYFNGESFLKYNVPSGSSALFGTGPYTVDFWHYMPAGTSLKDYASWFSTYTSANTDGIIIARYSSADRYGAWTNNGGWWDSGVNLLTDQWVHVAVVRKSTATGDTTFYLNGTSVGAAITDATDYDTPETPEFILGSLYTANTAYGLEGYMSDVRVCTGTELWTSNFTPPTRRNLSAPVVDRSGNDNGGNFATTEMTDVTTYRVGEVIEPITSATWDFDGTDDAISIKTDAFDLKCFTVAIKQGGVHAGPFPAVPGQVNVGMNIGTGGFNGIIMGSWTGTMDDETLSLWGYNSTPSTGSSATYIKDEIKVGWHIFTFNWNGSDYDIWVDGTKRITFARGGGSGHSGLLSGVTAIYPGRSLGWSTDYFEGNIGFFRAYDKSLSDQQIIENFHAKRNSLDIANWGNRDIVQNGLDVWLDAGVAASYPESGSTWYDLTANNYNGTIANATYDVYGDGSLSFDGSGDTVDVGPISTAGDHSNCTISIWMNKAAQVANYGNVYDCNYGATTYNKGPRMEVDIAGSIVRVYMGSDGGNYTSISFGSLSNDVWYNLVLTVEPNSTSQDLKSYTDGALVSSSTSSSTFVWDGDVADLYLGVGFTAGRHFTGKIAAFELYNRVLSASEIEQNFIVQKQRFDK